MAKSIRVFKNKPKNIYLDYAASASPNPSSIHGEGVKARAKLENSRKDVASILHARPSEIIFTSGGTEGNNLAIQGVVNAARAQENFSALPASGLRHGRNLPAPLPHVVTTNIEHPSVIETLKILEKRRLIEATFVPVESNGIVDPRKIKKEIKENTVLVSVMYANNEIGTIQPIREIAKEIRHYKKTRAQSLVPSAYPFFHTDAVQAVNYLDLNLEKLGVDLLTLSGAKIKDAGRVGVLYKKSGVEISRVFGGGDQEFGLRPGTENLGEIIKFAQAFKKVQIAREKESARLEKLRDYFFASLFKIFSRYDLLLRGGSLADKKFQKASLLVNGDLKNRLPNNVNITIPNIPSDLLVIELSAKGIMASSKSACESSRATGSYVIEAIRPGADKEIGGLRFTFGENTKKSDIDYTVKCLNQILKKLKKWYA